METTYSLTQPVLSFLSSHTEIFLFVLFSLLQFQLCACCFSPSFTTDFLKWSSQRVLPFIHPLPWLSSSSFLISVINRCSVFPSLNQHVESRHFSCVVLALDDDELEEEEEELEGMRFPGRYSRAHLNCFIMLLPRCLPPTKMKKMRRKRKKKFEENSTALRKVGG